jgi:hypothetical protein
MATPPSPVPGATVVSPTSAATVSAQPAVASPSPQALIRAIGDLPAADGALPALETRNQSQDPGFISPVQVTFQFAQPIASAEVLRTIVDGVQAMTGVAAVKSDGVHMIVQYDTARVQPAQIRERLEELGYTLAPGGDVPDAGDSSD